MRNITKKLSLVLLFVFALSITGCLGNRSNTFEEQSNQEDTNQEEQVQDPTPGDEIAQDDSDPVDLRNLAPYDPNGNRRPVVTSFSTDDIDQPVVSQGQTISFNATALDPNGRNVSIRYEATGGTISGNRWTAPDAGGIYQIKAIANDGEFDSDPEIITLRVPGTAGGVNPISIGVKRTAANNAPGGPKRIISSVSSSLEGDKAIIETGEEVEIQLQYTTSDNVAVTPEFSVNADTGTLVQKSEEKDDDTYTRTYTYTAPQTAPDGNSLTLTFNIVNVSNPYDYADASTTLTVNTPPQIVSVEFEGLAKTSITPGQTKTIVVDARDADDDTLTYFYEIYEGEGTLGEDTNPDGQVEYFAGAESGTERVIAIVTDNRGSSAQKIFTIANTDPIYMVLADGVNSYSDVTVDDGDPGQLDTAYSITTTDSQDEFPTDTDQQVQSPVFTSADEETAFDGGIELYTSELSDPNISYSSEYTWENLIGTKEFSGTFKTATTDPETPEWRALYPGRHEIKATQDITLTSGLQSSNVKQVQEGVVYVNESTRIDSISYTDENGETQNIFDNLTGMSEHQVSPGQQLTFRATVYDADNDRVAPEADKPGYFADTADKFYVAMVDGDFTNPFQTGELTDKAWIEDGDGYDHTNTVGATSLSMSYEIHPLAPVGAQKIVFRVADGMDNTLKAAAGDYADSTVLENNALSALPDGDGIAYAFDADNEGLNARTDYAIGGSYIKIGYHPEKTNQNYNLYLEYIGEISGDDTWKVYDETAGAYIKDEDGEDIVIVAGVGDHDGALEAADALDAPFDWLLVDIPAGVQAEVADDDKVYFQTYTTQVVLELEVVEGPRLTTVEYNKYVTLGDTSRIRVYGNYNDEAAIVNIRQTSDDGGFFEAEDDDFGNNVQYQLWTYTAPNTWPGGDGKVTAVVTIIDANDPSITNSREISFYLNRDPEIGDMRPTWGVDTQDGVWTKKGVRNIPLSAVVSDSDTNTQAADIFGFEWSLVGNDSGSLDFYNTNSARWDPWNGSTALGATGGPTNNGQYPIQLTVIDKDKDGLPKSGIDHRTIMIGINEDPRVDTLEVDGSTGTPATNEFQNIEGVADSNGDGEWSLAYGTPWAEDERVQQVNDPNGSGAATIDFNQGSGEYDGLKLFAYPNGVEDEPDDRNNLNYMYYITEGTADGAALTSETFEYIPHTDVANEIATKALRWTPSLDLRRQGGKYYLHFRVTDPKMGVAKGIHTETIEINVTKDETIDTPDPVAAKVEVKVNNARDWEDLDELAADPGHNRTLKAGSRIKITLSIDGAADIPRDTESVNVNIEGLLNGVITGDEADQVWMSLDRENADDPTEDTFVGEYLIPEETGYEVGTMTVDSANNLFNAPTHGLTDLSPIYLSDLPAGNGEIEEGRRYYVILTDANNFQIAATPEGAEDDTAVEFTLYGDLADSITGIWTTGIDTDLTTPVSVLQEIKAQDYAGNEAETLSGQIASGTAGTDTVVTVGKHGLETGDNVYFVNIDPVTATTVPGPGDLVENNDYAITVVDDTSFTVDGTFDTDFTDGTWVKANNWGAEQYDLDYNAPAVGAVTDSTTRTRNIEALSGGVEGVDGVGLFTTDEAHNLEIGMPIYLTDIVPDTEANYAEDTVYYVLTVPNSDEFTVEAAENGGGVGAPTGAFEANWSTRGSSQNGNTGLDMSHADIASDVIKIGDKVDLSVNMESDADSAGSADRTAGLAYLEDLVGTDPISADGSDYIVPTAIKSGDVTGVANATAIITSAGHTLSAGDPVYFINITHPGANDPGNSIELAKRYYVIGPVVAGSFAISETRGGTALGDLVAADDNFRATWVTNLTSLIVLEDAISLSTAKADEAEITPDHVETDLVFKENSTVSTWGITDYDIWFRATDDAVASTEANAWPDDEDLGNTDYTAKNLLNSGTNDGMDLKRPLVLSVDIYSYDKDAESGDLGYAPVGDRDNTTDLTDFEVIDYTLFDGSDVDDAKDMLDDSDANTAEIVRIKFDEPLLVKEGAATNQQVVSTLNNYSLTVNKFIDGTNTIDVSTGVQATTSEHATTPLTDIDVVELEYLKSWAYVESGTGTTATSTLYIVIQSDELTETVAVDEGTGVITGTGTKFLTEVDLGDILEVYDSTGPSTHTYKIEAVNSDTELEVTVISTAGGNIGAGAPAVKAVDRVETGNHFEVIFADYKTDTTLEGKQPLRILTDQHGNAIDSGSNNYTKGNPAVSW